LVAGGNSFAQCGTPSDLNFARGDQKVFDFNAVYPLLLKKVGEARVAKKFRK
jgi:hypothetical protein